MTLVELLKVCASNAASRYMAGTPSITDDSQIIMDGANRIRDLENQLAAAKAAASEWEAAANLHERNAGGLLDQLAAEREAVMVLAEDLWKLAIGCHQHDETAGFDAKPEDWIGVEVDNNPIAHAAVEKARGA